VRAVPQSENHRVREFANIAVIVDPGDTPVELAALEVVVLSQGGGVDVGLGVGRVDHPAEVLVSRDLESVLSGRGLRGPPEDEATSAADRAETGWRRQDLREDLRRGVWAGRRAARLREFSTDAPAEEAVAGDQRCDEGR